MAEPRNERHQGRKVTESQEMLIIRELMLVLVPQLSIATSNHACLSYRSDANGLGPAFGTISHSHRRYDRMHDPKRHDIESLDQLHDVRCLVLCLGLGPAAIEELGRLDTGVDVELAQAQLLGEHLLASAVDQVERCADRSEGRAVAHQEGRADRTALAERHAHLTRSLEHGASNLSRERALPLVVLHQRIIDKVHDLLCEIVVEVRRAILDPILWRGARVRNRSSWRCRQMRSPACVVP